MLIGWVGRSGCRFRLVGAGGFKRVRLVLLCLCFFPYDSLSSDIVSFPTFTRYTGARPCTYTFVTDFVLFPFLL